MSPSSGRLRTRIGDDLFILTLLLFACYAYTVDIDHYGQNSLDTPAEILGRRFRGKSFFDGTKLPLVVGISKTTSNGMNLLESAALR
jgi:hypothetical protein